MTMTEPREHPMKTRRKQAPKMRVYGIMDSDGRISLPGSMVAELFYRKIDAKDCCNSLDDQEVVAFELIPVPVRRKSK